MNHEEIIAKIKEENYLLFKTTLVGMTEGCMVEVTESNGNVVESLQYEAHELAKAQAHMLSLAGQWANKGVLTIINPFTN